MSLCSAGTSAGTEPLFSWPLILQEIRLGFLGFLFFLRYCIISRVVTKLTPTCKHFVISFFLTFAIAPIAKASHLAKLRVCVGEDFQRVWMQRSVTNQAITTIYEYTLRLPKLWAFLKSWSLGPTKWRYGW